MLVKHSWYPKPKVALGGKWSAHVPCSVALQETERKPRVATHRGEALAPMGPCVAWKEESAPTVSLPAPLLMCRAVQSRCQRAKGGENVQDRDERRKNSSANIMEMEQTELVDHSSPSGLRSVLLHMDTELKEKPQLLQHFRRIPK